MQTNPNLTNVDQADWGFSIDPNAYHVTLWARTRRLLAGGVRMGTINGDTGVMHGPERPAIIAHRYWCPRCDAQPGEPCRLSPKFTQDYSHESRHQVARRAMWRELSRELDIQTGWTVER